MIALLDNTVLSNFALVGQVDLGEITLAEGNRLLTQMIAYGYHSPIDSPERVFQADSRATALLRWQQAAARRAVLVPDEAIVTRRPARFHPTFTPCVYSINRGPC